MFLTRTRKGLPAGLVLSLILLVSGCAGASATAIPTGPGRYGSPSSQIETYFSGSQAPRRPCEQVGVVKGHYRAATVWDSAEVSDVLPELHAKARDLGADAVIITSTNRYLGPALNPFYRTIPNIEVVALAVHYLPATTPQTATPPVTALAPPSVSGSPSLADAVERVTPSVVLIETDQKTGSGVIVDPGGGVLTAAHVIEGATVIMVVLADGTRTNATIRGQNTDADVALLNVPFTNLRAAPMGSSQSLRPGEEVAVIGAPFGLDRTITRGVVSALRVLPDGVKLIQTDAAINPGNSGGPVINLRGEVLGISSFKIVKDQAQGLGFAVAVDTALTLLRASPTSVAPLLAAPAVAQPLAAAVSVTGTYSGNISGVQAGRGFAMTVTFTMVQQSDRVSATWTTSGGTSGTAAGRLSGTEILEFFATQLTPCPGVLRGSVSVENQGAFLRGAYAGEGCGMPVSASFIVNRQP
jgi:S1-C subfamily serine protease